MTTEREDARASSTDPPSPARAMLAQGRRLREIAAALHVKLTTLHRALASTQHP